MIARPKISQNEWKTAEKGAFEVGNCALLSCPVRDLGRLHAVVDELRLPRPAEEHGHVVAEVLRAPLRRALELARGRRAKDHDVPAAGPRAGAAAGAQRRELGEGAAAALAAEHVVDEGHEGVALLAGAGAPPARGRLRLLGLDDGDDAAGPAAVLVLDDEVRRPGRRHGHGRGDGRRHDRSGPGRRVHVHIRGSFFGYEASLTFSLSASGSRRRRARCWPVGSSRSRGMCYAPAASGRSQRVSPVAVFRK